MFSICLYSLLFISVRKKKSYRRDMRDQGLQGNSPTRRLANATMLPTNDGESTRVGWLFFSLNFVKPIFKFAIGRCLRSCETVGSATHSSSVHYRPEIMSV